MEILNTKQALKNVLAPLKKLGAKIAIVPTMGALHKGHLSLIALAQQQAEIVVCTIFVNPTQFTDPKDLEKYPRPLVHDIQMLTDAGCDFVFMPTVNEMYPNFPKPENWKIDLGPAEFLLEGEFRKGHYQGVTQIVKKLFDAVLPDIAFFGQKDFQQVLMIRQMVKLFKLPIEIVACPIIREEDDLAMSSRNIHLTVNDRAQALVLSKALFYLAANFKRFDLADLLQHAKNMITQTAGVELDYLVIANGDTLLPAQSKQGNLVALVAADVGDTRLIDNVVLNWLP